MNRRLSPILLLLALLAGACAPQRTCPPLPWDAWGTVRDIQDLPQDPVFYAEQIEAWPAPTKDALQAAQQHYLKRFFAPWRQETTHLDAAEAFWGIASYGAKQGYGENLRPRDPAWIEERINDMNTKAFPSLARKAITVRNTNLRVMPTAHPFFFDPREAGEGYPFDYFQASSLWAGTPVFISHKNREGGWLFVEAPFTSGWIPAADIAYVTNEQIRRYTEPEAGFAAVTRDDTVLHASDGLYLLTAHLGCLFPVNADKSLNVAVRNAHGEAIFVPASAPKDACAPFPLPLEPLVVAEIARGIMGQAYGWAGMYENRDCSAMTRDLFAPCGIWLPRNSKPQAAQGRVISLDGLSPEEKEQVILDKGVPFRTLLGQPGHIMLYVGSYKGRALVLHSTWGLRVTDACGRNGRRIIGRAVITTLTPGSEMPDVRRSEYSLLKRITAMAILAEPEQ